MKGLNGDRAETVLMEFGEFGATSSNVIIDK
jgi:hypothetical protein